LRFRVAHEVAHAFFYRRRRGEPERLVHDTPEQERFADEFARALLVPCGLAAEADPTAGGVLRLQQLCDVSLEVAVRAFADAHSDVAAVLLFWPTDVPATLTQARVQWASEGAPFGVGRSPADGPLNLSALSANFDAGAVAKSYDAGPAVMLDDRRQLLWVDHAALAPS
jgi:hypothetical protein